MLRTGVPLLLVLLAGTPAANGQSPADDTVQRATAVPSRVSCRYTLRAP